MRAPGPSPYKGHFFWAWGGNLCLQGDLRSLPSLFAHLPGGGRVEPSHWGMSSGAEGLLSRTGLCLGIAPSGMGWIPKTQTTLSALCCTRFSSMLTSRAVRE